jgi:hypothetical protein
MILGGPKITPKDADSSGQSGNKGAALTTYLSLPGLCSCLLPYYSLQLDLAPSSVMTSVPARSNGSGSPSFFLPEEGAAPPNQLCDLLQ